MNDTTQPTVLEQIEEINNVEIGGLCDEFRCLAGLLLGTTQDDGDKHKEIRLCDVGLLVSGIQARLQEAKNKIENLVC